MQSRRSLMKSLVVLPVAGAIAKSNMFASASTAAVALNRNQTPKDDPRYERKYLAVKVIRFIAGAQQCHFDSMGRYGTLSDLKKSKTLERYADSNVGAQTAMGRSLYEQLSLDRKEIIPGWQCELTVGDHGRAYVVSLKDVSEHNLGNLSSNQGGIIYQGKSSAPMVAQSVWKAKDVFVGARPILGSGDGILDLL